MISEELGLILGMSVVLCLTSLGGGATWKYCIKPVLDKKKQEQKQLEQLRNTVSVLKLESQEIRQQREELENSILEEREKFNLLQKQHEYQLLQQKKNSGDKKNNIPFFTIDGGNLKTDTTNLQIDNSTSYQSSYHQNDFFIEKSKKRKTRKALDCILEEKKYEGEEILNLEEATAQLLKEQSELQNELNQSKQKNAVIVNTNFGVTNVWKK